MIIDYTDKIKGCIKAQGKGRNVLILRKLDNLFKRFDGKKARYELEYRWLSCDCKRENDEAYCCCQGNEFTYWQTKEIRGALRGKNLFKTFNLF